MQETTEDTGSIPASGRSPGGRNSNSLHYSCLSNRMDCSPPGPWAAKESDTTKCVLNNNSLQTIMRAINKHQHVITQACSSEAHHCCDRLLQAHSATESGVHSWLPFHRMSPTLTRSSQPLPDGAGTLRRTQACGGRPPPSGVAALEE